MTLKKLFLAAMASVLVSTGMQAQVENFEIFRHVGGNLNVGTEGIGFDVATPVTDYLEVSAGMSFMPGFKVDGDVKVKPIRITDVTTIPMESVNIEGKFARTTANFKVSCYPFGTQNALFVAAGFSFGGKKIAKLKGHSEDVKTSWQTRSILPMLRIRSMLRSTSMMSASMRMATCWATCASTVSVLTSDWAMDVWFPRVVLVSVWNWVASLWAT